MSTALTEPVYHTELIDGREIKKPYREILQR